MRRLTLIENDKQGVFDVLRKVIETQGFDVLYADRYHLEIEAVKAQRFGRKKHLSVRLIEFKRPELGVNIEVRNMGLEIKRNKRNDLLEARIEREMMAQLRASKKSSAA